VEVPKKGKEETHIIGGKTKISLGIHFEKHGCGDWGSQKEKNENLG